jgi:hypothetical protein
MKSFASLLTWAIGLLGASRARAAGIGDVPLRAEDRIGVSFSTTMTASPQTKAVKTLALIPSLAGAYRPSERWTITGDVALTMTSYRFADQERGGITRISNPVAGVHFSAFASDRLRLRIGVAAGAPLVTAPGGLVTNAAAEHADRAATAATGQSMYWLWARNAVPIIALARLEYFIEEVVVRLDLEPGLLVSVNRDPSSAALLGAFEAAMRLGAFSPGLRLTSLFTSRQRDTGDFSQSTVTGFLRWEGDHVFAGAEAVTGIDEPQGLARADQTSWGVVVNVGGRF